MLENSNRHSLDSSHNKEITGVVIQEENKSVAFSRDLESSRNFSSRMNFFVAYLTFFVFGLSPWLLVNALYLELPIFIENISEGASIVVFMSSAIQLANIVAFFFVWWQTRHSPLPYSLSISGIIVLAIIDSFLVGCFWDVEVNILNSMHSVTLLVWTFLAGCVGCLSMVIFFPFASQYDPVLISATSTGMGCNGLLASLIALIQNPGSNTQPRFSVFVYFLLFTLVLFLSLGSFLIILNWNIIQHYKFDYQQATKAADVSLKISNERERLLVSSESQSSESASSVREEISIEAKTTEPIGKDEGSLTISQTWLSNLGVLKLASKPILNQFYNCLLNYSLLSIAPYSVMGFSNSSELLMWLITLGMIFGASGRFLTSFFHHPFLIPINLLQTVLSIYILVMSFFGKSPLQMLGSGGWILVMVNAFFSLINGYQNAILFQSIHKDFPSNLIEKVSQFVGMSNQIGAFIGTMISFILVISGAIS